MIESSLRIVEAVKAIRKTIPAGVTLLAAAKTRTLPEVEAVIEAGVTHIGYNYIQESLPIIRAIGSRATWHMIGHLQRNKAKVAAEFFDIIETVDSWALAQALERHAASLQKKLPILVEINSGREPNKDGVLPEEVDELIAQLSTLTYLQVQGLMTMGPRFGNPEDSRPFFVATRQVFDRLAKQSLPNVEMRYLSMGMSNSYLIAIQEGANIVRIGTKLFGERSE
ncbi:alanine racemase [Ornatilinea apprima]|uniref:Pyridoxal phosphate homeostasis protein n=1 Tax=Ornatilinea apprima TaxID=1134406 RepID=A0A0P6X518_9CHLR|nr:YggS family pyridoxal phosphate-dependent enzyme [Ornatilinea apprima]KPL76933.1 alanine racemase [Ornatilinea apprima]